MRMVNAFPARQMGEVVNPFSAEMNAVPKLVAGRLIGLWTDDPGDQ
jgi:hypothetical protein